ncbi:sybindin family protein [Cardiosporidium cionae]|uniref:Trafficking protein particle complex subunit n=1 Tax=Cardiosporidium cionae TaxID=476202 RepID=A0ABQ7J6B4_9APIC|nr:sybindin family protein [Cardiosporidium cionae]|eukprot:KAF8819498.1 sybindin family protein [Cardiosporidium cionae]
MYSLFINNVHGSLLYHRNFSPKVQLSSNEEIRVASTFHGLSAIASRLSPVLSHENSQLSFLEPTGINSIEADNFRLICYETLTGLKFYLVAETQVTNLEYYLKKVYEAFSDYVLKNPFYDIDMPIRCELFDKAIEKLFYDSTPVIK